MWWKIAIPILTIVVLIVTAFSASNFTAGDGFAPAGVKGILSAIATGGVVFAYLGFEQAIQFGGESRDPAAQHPVRGDRGDVIGSIVYILLELAFVGALRPRTPPPTAGPTSASPTSSGPTPRSPAGSVSAGSRSAATSTRSCRPPAPA